MDLSVKNKGGGAGDHICTGRQKARSSQHLSVAKNLQPTHP